MFSCVVENESRFLEGSSYEIHSVHPAKNDHDHSEICGIKYGGLKGHAETPMFSIVYMLNFAVPHVAPTLTYPGCS